MISFLNSSFFFFGIFWKCCMNGFYCSLLLVPPQHRAHEQHPFHWFMLVLFIFFFFIFVASFFLIALGVFQKCCMNGFYCSMLLVPSPTSSIWMLNDHHSLDVKWPSSIWLISSLCPITSTSLNLVPNAQVCVYLTVHITKLQLQTTFPKPFYIPHSACIHRDLSRWKSWCLHFLWPVK